MAYFPKVGIILFSIGSKKEVFRDENLSDHQVAGKDLVLGKHPELVGARCQHGDIDAGLGPAHFELVLPADDDPARVVNIGSMDGLHIPTVTGVGTYAYTASKAAVHHLTRHLAVELGPRNITVNAVAPGFFPSKMTDQVFEERLADIEHNSLLGRVGQDEEMAGIAIYLCSRAGAYTHGAVIPVDGGTSINWRHA